MINKNEIGRYPTNPRIAVEDVLANNKGYCLTKEEIYELLPRLGNERVITIGQLNSTLSGLTRFGLVECVYIKSRAYYSIREDI